MQLTITTDYAIRIIMYLSKTRRVTSAGEISEQVGIAKKSLLATANKLRSAKLIAGHMGVSGGYSLMRRPEDITLLDIMKVTEGSIKINHCLEHGKSNPCFRSEYCPVHEFYCGLQEKLEGYFTSVTIQQLLDRAAKLPKETFKEKTSEHSAL